VRLGETRPPGDLADTQAYATGVELPDTVEGLGSGRGPYELLSIGAGRTQVILSEETVQREQSADNTNCPANARLRSSQLRHYRTWFASRCGSLGLRPMLTGIDG
jgi:hypothetical protein